MNQQLCLTLEPPKARRRDPSTSHAAAKAAERFQASHAGRIREALLEQPMTANEIAFATGLTVVQVCRRLPEIEGVRVMTIGGQALERDGFRVWMAC